MSSTGVMSSVCLLINPPQKSVGPATRRPRCRAPTSCDSRLREGAQSTQQPRTKAAAILVRPSVGHHSPPNIPSGSAPLNSSDFVPVRPPSILEHVPRMPYKDRRHAHSALTTDQYRPQAISPALARHIHGKVRYACQRSPIQQLVRSCRVVHRQHSLFARMACRASREAFTTLGMLAHTQCELQAFRIPDAEPAHLQAILRHRGRGGHRRPSVRGAPRSQRAGAQTDLRALRKLYHHRGAPIDIPRYPRPEGRRLPTIRADKYDNFRLYHQTQTSPAPPSPGRLRFHSRSTKAPKQIGGPDCRIASLLIQDDRLQPHQLYRSLRNRTSARELHYHLITCLMGEEISTRSMQPGSTALSLYQSLRGTSRPFNMATRRGSVVSHYTAQFKQLGQLHEKLTCQSGLAIQQANLVKKRGTALRLVFLGDVNGRRQALALVQDSPSSPRNSGITSVQTDNCERSQSLPRPIQTAIASGFALVISMFRVATVGRGVSAALSFLWQELATAFNSTVLPAPFGPRHAAHRLEYAAVISAPRPYATEGPQEPHRMCKGEPAPSSARPELPALGGNNISAIGSTGAVDHLPQVTRYGNRGSDEGNTWERSDKNGADQRSERPPSRQTPPP